MLLNYLKIALRSLWKHKLFSFINVIGLGLAMAFCFMQLIQVQSSFEKDTFHPYADRTYRIITDATGTDGTKHSLASTPFPLGEKLKQEQSSIEKSVRVIRAFGGSFSNGAKSLQASGLYADPAYFEVFGFKLAHGKPAVEPRTVVLTHETAERFFGTANPVGRTLTHRELGTFTIVGVFAPLGKHQTHLKSDMVVSMATFPLLHPERQPDSWLDYNTYTFVLLTKGTPPQALDRALAAVAQESNQRLNVKDLKGHAFRSQALGDISPDFENLLNNPYVEPIWKIGVSLLIPLVIILLASFNYVNLTLTRSLSRAREVGVRKVAGAKRWQLVNQFLVESVIVAFLALVVGYLGLLFMKSYVQVRWLTWEVLNPQLLWLTFLGFTLGVALLAGFLPARILASYQPVQVLKGTLAPVSVGKVNFRKVLTIIQFVVALALMTFTGIMNSQFEYMATDNQNFNRKNILNIPLAAGSDFRLLANEMSKEASVERVGLTSAPFNEAAGKGELRKVGPAGQEQPAKETYLYATNAPFIENMQLTFVAGTNLPPTADTTVHFVVLNEKAVNSLGWNNPQEVVGQTLLLNQTEVLVAGVVKNFCFMRYELPVAPLVLGYDPKEIKVLSLQITDGANQEHVTASLANIWKRYQPHDSFVYSWYEEQLYDDYSQGGDRKLTGLMILIVFVIASLGLLGMVTYTTEKRTKEVGVRKVLGASVAQIMGLLSGTFVKMILIAAAIALPLGYFLGSLFLTIFTYRASLGPGVFLTCLGSLLAIGLLTIGLQTYKAALTNPADTLRSE